MRPRSRLQALAAAAALTLSLSGCGDGGEEQPTAAAPTPGAMTSAPSSALSDAERAAVLRLREEEKLARDLYLVLGASSGDRRFTRIAQSEQRHMDLVGSLLQRYGLADPARPTPGEFQDPELQALYDRLERDGAPSPAAAIAQGVIVEETDIADIDAQAGDIRHPDVAEVFAVLREGSVRHLAAFRRG